MTPPGSLLASIYGLYVLAVITPGPNTFIVTRLALSTTRRHSAWAVLGIGLGNAAWLGITLGGVAVLLQRLPGGLLAVRLAGGLYLLYLGLKGLLPTRAAPRVSGTEQPGPERVNPAPADEEGRPFRSGVLTSLSNPNTLPFYLGLLAPTLTPDTLLWVRLAAALGIVTLGMAWYGTLAWGLSTGLVRQVYTRREPLIRRLLALVLVVYGVRLLVSV